MNFEKITSCILDVFEKCNIRSFPIDCFDILEHYGYKAIKYSELSASKRKACLLLSKDACTIEDTIYYEDGNLEERIRFSIMHELGHILLLTDDEDTVDTFASYTLAPRIIIHKRGYRTCDTIHDAFGLSYAASNRALLDYYSWYNRICSTTQRPSPPEQQLERIFFPPHLEAGEKRKPGNLTQKRRRKTRNRRLLEEQTSFLQEQRQLRSDASIFAAAENKRLFGNDL